MLITVNGKNREVEAGTTVADLVAELPHRGVAVAIDGSVIRRGDQQAVVITEGAQVEIVTAVQGG